MSDKDKAYNEGREEAKSDGPIGGLAHMVGDLFSPDSWKSDDAKAREAGYQDEVKGKK